MDKEDRFTKGLSISVVPESLRIRFTRELNDLREGNVSEVNFPTTLSTVERKFLHSLSQELGLTSKSKGKDEKRYITVTKGKKPGANNDAIIHPFFDLAPQTKKELLPSLANYAHVLSSIKNAKLNKKGPKKSSTATAAVGGADIESIASLKNNAPKLYQAQKRATTKEDYKSILLGERSDIESITVYGGEDASPPVYGKVYIAVKPNGNTAYSAATKNALKTSVLKKTNVVTVTPEIVDPIFYYLLIDTIVNYDPVTLLITEDSLKALINTSIGGYFTNSLQKFDNKFRYSVLSKLIDNTNVSIRNSKTVIKYQMRISPTTLKVAATYTMEFNTTLTKGSLSSTAFTASDGFTYTLIDDSLGNVKLVRSTYSSGTVTIDIPATYMTLVSGSEILGTIDYTTGKIILNSFTPHTISDGKTYIKMTVTPGTNNQDVTPLREQIITTDVNDTAAINIIMVAETII